MQEKDINLKNYARFLEQKKVEAIYVSVGTIAGQTTGIETSLAALGVNINMASGAMHTMANQSVDTSAKIDGLGVGVKALLDSEGTASDRMERLLAMLPDLPRALDALNFTLTRTITMANMHEMLRRDSLRELHSSGQCLAPVPLSRGTGNH
jgi:hypothetical protein